MTITDVKEITSGAKPRCRVYLDEEFAFVLYKGELRLYDISVGNELPIDIYQEIRDEILPKRARMRAFYLLGKRSYTEKQMRQKLSQGEYPPDIIDLTIDYLKSSRYIDDIQYARGYIEYHLHEKSRNQLLRDLEEKGIPQEITSVIYFELTEDAEENIEEKQISQWLIKKRFDKNTADFKEKQRIFAFLYRKGYSPETIKRLL